VTMTDAPEILVGEAASVSFDDGWDAAARKSRHATIFQSAAWYRAWSMGVAPAEGATPLVIRISCEDELRAGLALQICDRVLAPLGSPWSDYHEAILSDEDDQALEMLAATLGEVLSNRGLSFHGEDICAGGMLERVLRRLGGRGSTSSQVVAIDLRNAEHVEKLLDGNEHKVKRRRLERRGMLRYEHWTRPDDVRGRLEALIDMHRQQWSDNPDVVAPFDETVEHGFRSFVDQIAPVGEVVLSEITLDGVPLAMYFGFLREKRFYAYRTCYRREYFAYSPGHILLKSMIRDFHTRGVHAFDLMRGGYDYKHLYASNVANNVAFEIDDTRMGPVTAGA
jgi:CelD/BcsL family acetyltransferase involved in cellulose biosynthesis